jgi:hypothetical protein
MKRHLNAIACWDGACNPNAIAHGLTEAFSEISQEQNFHGTYSLTKDPAIRVMVYQLAYLCGVITGAEEFPRGETIIECVDACKFAAKQ